MEINASRYIEMLWLLGFIILFIIIAYSLRYLINGKIFGAALSTIYGAHEVTSKTPILVVGNISSKTRKAIQTLKKRGARVEYTQLSNMIEYIENKSLSPVVLVGENSVSCQLLDYQRSYPIEVRGIVLIEPSYKMSDLRAPDNVIAHISKPTIQDDQIFTHLDKSMEPLDIADSINNLL